MVKSYIEKWFIKLTTGFGLGFTFPQGRDGQNGAMPSARTNWFRISKIIASVYGQVSETFSNTESLNIVYFSNGSTGVSKNVAQA